MKVLVLTLAYGRAGMEQQVVAFLRWARAYRERFLFVGVQGSYPLRLVQELGIATVAIPRSRWRELSLMHCLRRLLVQYQIGLIHAHGPKAGVLAGLAARCVPGLPVVTTIHNCHLQQMRQGTLSRPLALYYLGLVQGVRLLGGYFIAVSQAIRADLLRQKVPPGRIVVIPNGIDIDRFQVTQQGQERRTELGITAEALVVGTVGRLSPEKGHDTLLRAWKLLVSVYPHARLLLVGAGPLEHRLRSLARALDISDCVLFVGHREDVPELLAAIDIFVLPSLQEGFGLSLVEAMVTGKPVVATRVEAIPEIVDHGVTGLLVPPRCPASLAAALQRLLDDEELRQHLGQAGRARAMRDFSLCRSGQLCLELYQNRGAAFAQPYAMSPEWKR